jgi:hypothetical protein
MYKIGLTLMVRARPDPITLARVSPCVDARSRTRCQSGENVRLDQSGFSGKRKPPPETIRRALSSTFAR